MKQELKYGGPIANIERSKQNSSWKNQRTLCIHSEHMSQTLYNLGLVNAKSLILTFPNWLDEGLIPHFVRGYFDGDGCVHYSEKYRKCYTKTAGTKSFCESLSSIFTRLKIKHHIIHPKQSLDKNT
jgi:hypothetical protein